MIFLLPQGATFILRLNKEQAYLWGKEHIDY